jgi:hypothetical protein
VRGALFLLLTAFCALASRGDGGGGSSTTGNVPALDHVIVIVMENKSYAAAKTGPYTASLVASGASFANDHSIGHPSQPNYLVLWSGHTQGVTSDICPASGAPFAADNLGSACEAAGRTWRAYAEDLPEPGSAACTANNGLYLRRHAPWAEFSNLTHANERPYSDLAADIAAGALPDLAFVIPNMCHDTHQCPLAQGDQWLAQNVPAMLDAVGPKGVVVLTWDEDDDRAGNQILTVIAGEPAMPGFVSHRPINHYTLVRTICATLGLPPVGDTKNVAPITDVWKATPSASETIAGPRR